MKSHARARLAGVLFVVLLAAGCVSLADLSALSTRVQEAGYIGVSVKHNTTNGHDTIAVNAYKTDDETDDGEKIVRLIWDTYPAEVDEVVVGVNDKVRSFTTEELEKKYGPRGVQVKEEESGSGTAAVWIAVVFVLLVTTLVTVLTVRARRRNRAPIAPPPYPQVPYHYEP
ncbi:hypothetical protein SUDANB95_02072 [Actinosynnema sp. ALI-1.44]